MFVKPRNNRVMYLVSSDQDSLFPYVVFDADRR